jgi:glucose-1-phosphate thymidylyltransferase
MVFKGVIVPACAAAATAARFGESSPAALQRVANRPIVCHVLDKLRDAGAIEVALVVSNAAAEEIKECVAADGPRDVQTSYLLYDDAGTLERALAGAAEFVGEAPCIVHVADGLLAEPLAPFTELLREDATDLVVLVREGAEAAESIGLGTRRLLRLAEVAPSGTILGLAGVCLFGPAALSHAKNTRWWPDRDLDLVSVAEQLVAGGGRLHVGCVSDWHRYNGDPHELLELNRLTLDALGPNLSRATAGGASNRIEGRVSIHPTASVQSSVIIGPAIVGAGALVLESYIGPYTSIGADVRIEGAEVERSIILAGASIMHVGGRLVASVVGRDARIFKDFSLPRAMRLNVGDGGEVALC